ncbi:hypothetical protein Q5P01_013958 [Channa striata]|uniref:Uncharacterized protein n=1 Tax=Channa striata TaxID=64152 RepID=A0AA88MK77_CHASR|nr:hypothetical protein Q5P01_013958 [Channa striata]
MIASGASSHGGDLGIDIPAGPAASACRQQMAVLLSAAWRHFTEDILKERRVTDTSRCSLHQLKEQSREKEAAGRLIDKLHSRPLRGC